MPIIKVSEGGGRALEGKEFKSEREMHDFIEENPQVLGENIRIIESRYKVTIESSEREMDLLAMDENSNQILVIELKDEEADEKAIPQVLRYGSWVRSNPASVKYKISKKFQEVNEEKIDYDKPKIMIVAPSINQALADMCQYIEAFDFDLIEFKRVVDPSTDKEIISTNMLESKEEKARPPVTYDFDWYRQKKGFDEEKIEEVEEIIDKIEKIRKDENWNLKKKFIKYSIRFQRRGQNVVRIKPRKRKEHVVAFRLGPNFDLKEIKDKDVEELAKKTTHINEDSKYWRIHLKNTDIEKFKPLIEISYNNIVE